MSITSVDICFGNCWGDEGKGKITSQLAKEGNYDYVCRWNGGNNAGHSVYINNKAYKTHLIPSGVFYNVKSIIGPGCVVNIKSFFEEISYLNNCGFNTNLIKISPSAHVVTDEHITCDKQKYKHQGTTCRGIAPCYRDKFGRTGKQVKDFPDFTNYLWDGFLCGKILCEGAQGFWLDIDYGNYPFVTSSNTLPYASCSLGFSPKLINNIYGAAKIYDTRVGTDPDFPESLLNNKQLKQVAITGKEYGVSTGRMRKTNWLNINKLIYSINISGTTILIISKTDILETLQYFKVIYNNKTINFETLEQMKVWIINTLKNKCTYLKRILFSNNPEKVNNLII
jgi:adenylosuccinate synthase